VEAAERYDESRGVPLERYAAQRILGAILDAARAADWAPRSARSRDRRLEGVEQRLATEFGRLPNPEEKAEALGMTMADLSRRQDRMFCSVVLALEHEVYEGADEDLALVDVLPERMTREPFEEMEHRELHSYLTDAVDLLPERHRLLVTGYFLESRTSQELADFLGLTESRISQLQSEVLCVLKEGLEAQYDAPARVGVRVQRRKERYSDSIGEASNWKSRLKPAISVEAVVF
jgi:RNA polymerase sigma factor for flagellar operon FliA